MFVMYKNFALILIAIFFSLNASEASSVLMKDDVQDEIVTLQTEDMYKVEAEIQDFKALKDEENSLKKVLKDVYNLEIEKYDKPSYLFEEPFTHRFKESSPMDYTHFWAAYNGDAGINFSQDGKITNHYEFNAINVGYDGFFKNNNADFRMMLRFVPESSRNFTQELFGDMYVATNKIPHHRFQAGYYRPQVGQEGGVSAYVIPFLNRSQISRNMGVARKLGARVVGNYPLVGYDVGVYSSDTYLKEFFPGGEFTSWVTLKPLGKTDGKYGDLKIAGGVQAGHRSNNYCVTGAYVGYDYKRFHADFEWAHANGYNGLSGHYTDKHAGGFYATLGYMITKKLQVLARYDQFDPDKNVTNDKNREYTLGLNYFIKGQALRFIVNYIFCQKDGAKDSHRILIGTQILF